MKKNEKLSESSTAKKRADYSSSKSKFKINK